MKLERKISEFGFINIDKPSGVSSSFVVNAVKRITGVPCGHLGTLDPLASGVLPVGIGNATRLFDYFLKKKKTYIAEFTFGEYSDTLDSTGEVIKGGRIPTKEEVEKILPSLCGDVMQMPPKYSAKNVNGKRGYELARSGVDFELTPKKVSIENITLLSVSDDKFIFSIDCGAGTYIRSIARDMAEALSTNALMSGLQRTKSGVFTIQNSVSFENLDLDIIEKNLIKTADVLPYESVTYPENHRVFHGIACNTNLKDGEYKIYCGNDFYGVAEVKNGVIKPTIKLC